MVSEDRLRHTETETQTEAGPEGLRQIEITGGTQTGGERQRIEEDMGKRQTDTKNEQQQTKTRRHKGKKAGQRQEDMKGKSDKDR